MNNEQLQQSRYIDLSQQQRSQYLAQSNYIYKDQTPSKTFFQEIKNNLKCIINEKDKIGQQFNQFKETIICQVNMTMGKIASSYHKTLQQKINLEEQLKKAKQSHKKMKMEVIQLRQMIDQFLKSYNKEISQKDKQIQQLKALLVNNQLSTLNLKQTKQESTQNHINILTNYKIQQKNVFQKELSQLDMLEKSLQNSQQYTYSPARLTQQSMIQLDPIQQESQRTVSNTTSHIATLRSQIPSQANNQSIQPSSKGTSDNKKSKNFIQNFRNSISSSFVENKQQQQNFQQKIYSRQKKSSPLKKLKIEVTLQKDILVNVEQRLNKQILVQANKAEDYCCQISKNSSSNNLASLGNTNKINVPLKNQSPKGIAFINRKLFYDDEKICLTEKQLTRNQTSFELQSKDLFITRQKTRHRRFMTEGSLQDNIQNINVQVHLTPASLKTKSRVSSNQKIILSRNVIQNNSSAKRKGSGSKQKLTVFSKNKIQQDSHANDFHLSMRKSKNLNNNFYLNSHRKNKASVHLGNKNYLNKVKKTIKDALNKYQLRLLTKNDQLFYKGEFTNQKRNGFGKLHYQNGITYQGHFVNDMKNGKGKLFVNGNQVFDGNWEDDRINGEGNMKNLQLLAQNCQECLKGSIYLGQFSSNKFHGIGTLYLPNKQKIVTKFASGIPYGEFTLYSAQNIQFGIWPE